MTRIRRSVRGVKSDQTREDSRELRKSAVEACTRAQHMRDQAVRLCEKLREEAERLDY
ncbi:MAG TPA: hypothetical protein VJN70_05210 [Gemmatimonadaceae bacterium]|nr:hypothetical protein [Gemmatimonadaceae bacterium]